MNKNNFIKIIKNNIYSDTLKIAAAINRDHISIIRNIQRYKKDFENLGKVELAVIPSKRNQNQNVYYLNEQQSIFLLTLMDNSPLVLELKKELSRQFVNMRKILLERQTEEWQNTRIEGKETRHNFTDCIKDFISYAKNQGSNNADKYYCIFSSLIDKTLSVHDKDYSSGDTLTNIKFLENMLISELNNYMDNNIFYKDIYSKCKSKCSQLKILLNDTNV
jgi:phage regulator Rha-like protein